ncbi:HNH endonuclease signature motif containing protein [Arthrobacter sp. Soil763]|uniref:HNH endonuclease signature motif containing protein n=1 Tax=Arthrobacter sp. Soil763 TaxID=1736402 RepID=UPI0006F32F80|nr:HNH endonuclease signature motif containing protein [Arthrobacter sp. Soil763]KRE78436.1 hypothetical protein ASG71_11205 [Arthrobacter sp. Soil763]
MQSGEAFSAEIGAAAAALAESSAVLEVLLGGAACGDDAGIDGADPLQVRSDAYLDGLAEVARAESRLAAVKVWLAAGYAHVTETLAGPVASPQDHTAREMGTVAEVACVLTVSERSASALLSDAQALTGSLPLTLGALQAGELSWQHARVMVDEAAGLDRAAAAALEGHFLDPAAPVPARGCPAGELVPGRFRAKARSWRERHHPASIEARHVRGAGDRRVEFIPDRDGMAWINAYLPAATATGIFDRLTAASRALQGPAEARTLTQLRADVAATLLLTRGAAPATAGGPGGVCAGVPVPRAQVLVTVPVFSLLGATEEPAVLDGYGPIPPSMARELVAEGADSIYRVLVDPRDGAPLEIGRTSYRIPKALRHWLRLRDAKCSFPACNNQSLDTEADHLLAWSNGGSTEISNLAQPCRKHHRLKHTTAWTPTTATPDLTGPTPRHATGEATGTPTCPTTCLATGPRPGRRTVPVTGPTAGSVAGRRLVRSRRTSRTRRRIPGRTRIRNYPRIPSPTGISSQPPTPPNRTTLSGRSSLDRPRAR